MTETPQASPDESETSRWSNEYAGFSHNVKRQRDAAIQQAANAPEIPPEVLADWMGDEDWRVQQSVLYYLGARGPSSPTLRDLGISLIEELLQQEDRHWRVELAALECALILSARELLPLIEEGSRRARLPYSLYEAQRRVLGMLSYLDGTLEGQLRALQYTRGSSEGAQLKETLYQTIYILWKNEPETLLALDNLSDLQPYERIAAEAVVFEPLPDWLDANEEERFLIPLYRLVRANRLQSYHCLDLLVREIDQEGLTPQRLYDLLVLDQRSQWGRGYILQTLAEYADEIAALLTEWLDDLGELRHNAVLWLGLLDTDTSPALPKLFQLLTNATDEEQQQLSSSIHNVIQNNKAPLPEDQLFTHLRTLLYGEFTKTTWRILRMLLETCRDLESIEVAIDYIDLHLPEEAREQQAQYKSWVQSLTTDEPSPFLRLLRRLMLSAVQGRELMQPEDMRDVLSCPHLAKVTHLDFQHIELIDELIDAVIEADHPQGLTHLYLNNTDITGEGLVQLLTGMRLPKLTHLYLSGNGPQQYELLAEHPILSQLEHINLKGSLMAETCTPLLQSQSLGRLKKIIVSNNGLNVHQLQLLLTESALPSEAIVVARDNELSVEDNAALTAAAVDKSIRLYL